MRLLLLLSFFIGTVFASVPIRKIGDPREACPYWKNVSEHREYSLEDYKAEEDCLYYYLLDREIEATHNYRSLYSRPPPEKNISITVLNLRVAHVELSKGSTYQFIIYGYADLQWNDSRVKWNIDDFPSITTLLISDSNKIWTPLMVDHALCTDMTTSSCDLQFNDMELDPEGIVNARMHFKYASMCAVDFYKYPEEENNCYIFFTVFEKNKTIRFTKMDDQKSKPRNNVVMKESLDRDSEMTRLNQDHSAWNIEEQSYGITHLMNIESLPALKVTVTAAKKMSTMKMALRLPVTIATLLMLVAPLFGDLRTQSYVKLLCLCIQTICFLYLCSIAPENGFAGQKPKIYRFYESVFALTTVSMITTVCCMALSRAKRTVPPSHRLFLSAKLVNRAVCCIEPEDSAHYQRYLEQNENQQASNEANYTHDWRHIYMAVNNLISGLFFTTFLFFVLLDVM